MRKMLSGRLLGCGLVVALLLASVAHPAVAQRVGASVHAGTLGTGARVTVSLTDRINVRGGIDFQPASIQVPALEAEGNEGGVDFNVELPTPAVTAVLDLFPGGSSFRVSAGVLYFAEPLALEGTPTEELAIGDHDYSPADVGTLRGSLGTTQIAPYLGIGWGDAVGPGLGFALDLGLAYHGEPDFRFEATGPASSNAQFRADLDAEADSINEDIPNFAAVYPILNLGFSFGL